MYTHKEAQKIANYYLEKVIGKPLSKAKAKSLPITEIKIEELNDHTFNVFCYGKASSSVIFFTTIDLVAKDLELLGPDEVLKLED
ncbi:hypothetical protein HYN48_13425 [Flavobacterium magnum]|uniref:Uncharacterized protein n=1 Tax=Flavobacterium magnum TaxID=2162713 RepID=A0A2S0RIB0_9FLAO|nr:hypothetical protein [Flavobacterium magnum]AWA31000.1 hypothetical protein HYN48_13425 [Flavobacterium magnum]